MYFILQGGGFQPAKRSNLSENDTDDSDGLGEFSLTKLAVKSRQQKKVKKYALRIISQKLCKRQIFQNHIFHYFAYF